jgi:hypothetical protein
MNTNTNTKKNSRYEHLLNNQFGSTIMYFYTFDTAQKNLTEINDLITKFDGVYKLIFEVIYSNKKLKMDYDIDSNKDLISNPEYIISKLFILKRSETKSNMVYFEINSYMIKHLKSNPNLKNINANLMASIKQYDEFDSNINTFLLSTIAPKIIRLNNVNFNIDPNENSETLFVTSEVETIADNSLFKKVKIVANSLFVVPTVELIKQKLTELSDSLYGDLNDAKSLYISRTILLLTNLMENQQEMDKLSLEYKLQFMFFN